MYHRGDRYILRYLYILKYAPIGLFEPVVVDLPDVSERGMGIGMPQAFRNDGQVDIMAEGYAGPGVARRV